ncbi:MAG: GSCFA domain-containing protein [Cyclobacteriaceae bacterium]
MLDLRTEVTPKLSSQKVSLSDKIFTIGSCFSQVIGVYFRDNKFDILSNPFGNVYNPLSIFKLIALGLKNEQPKTEGYLQQDEVHYHFDFHSDLSALSREDLEAKFKQKIVQVHQFLKDTNWLMITFGTAVVYHRNDNNELVANCHKVPQKEFDRSFLRIDDITQSFEKCYKELKALNPKINIILTVSPVRHTKETLTDNSYSKSLLRVACNEIAKFHPDVTYFPSFEIMIDDLRDYRYYGHDLIHPNELAEAYIWEKFKGTYLDENTQNILERWAKVKKSLSHRPKYPETKAHLDFLTATLINLENLEGKLNVRAEIKQIKGEIDSLSE